MKIQKKLKIDFFVCLWIDKRNADGCYINTHGLAALPEKCLCCDDYFAYYWNLGKKVKLKFTQQQYDVFVEEHRLSKLN